MSTVVIKARPEDLHIDEQFKRGRKRKKMKKKSIDDVRQLRVAVYCSVCGGGIVCIAFSPKLTER